MTDAMKKYVKNHGLIFSAWLLLSGVSAIVLGFTIFQLDYVSAAAAFSERGFPCAY